MFLARRLLLLLHTVSAVVFWAQRRRFCSLKSSETGFDGVFLAEFFAPLERSADIGGRLRPKYESSILVQICVYKGHNRYDMWECRGINPQRVHFLADYLLLYVVSR